MDQSNKKLKFFIDKQSRLSRDLEQAAANQEKELRRIEQELDIARKELERMSRDCKLRAEELKQVQGHNARVQEAEYELQVEALEVKLREAEAVRKQLQYQLEFCCT